MPPRMPSGRAHDTAHVRLAGHPLPGPVNTISHNLPHFNHGLLPPVTLRCPAAAHRYEYHARLGQGTDPHNRSEPGARKTKDQPLAPSDLHRHEQLPPQLETGKTGKTGLRGLSMKIPQCRSESWIEQSALSRDTPVPISVS